MKLSMVNDVVPAKYIISSGLNGYDKDAPKGAGIGARIYKDNKLRLALWSR